MILSYLKLTPGQMHALAEARAALSTVAATVEQVRSEASDWLDEQPVGAHDNQDLMADEMEELRDLADCLETQWGEMEGIVPMEKDGSYDQD